MGIRVKARLCLADIGALGTLRAQFARRTLLARTLAVGSQQTPAASLTRSPLGPKHVFTKRKYILSMSSRQIDGDSFMSRRDSTKTRRNQIV